MNDPTATPTPAQSDTPITDKYSGIAVSHPHFAPMVCDMFKLGRELAEARHSVYQVKQVDMPALQRELAAKDAGLNKFWEDLMEALGEEGHDELRPDGTYDSLKSAVESVRTAVSDLAASREECERLKQEWSDEHDARFRDVSDWMSDRDQLRDENATLRGLLEKYHAMMPTPESTAALAQKAGGTPQPSKEVFQEMQKLRAEFAQGGGE